MTDIMSRLRGKADMIGDGSNGHKLLLDAADEIERLRAELASMKSELKEISIALNDPADNLIRTTAECVSELRKDAKRYLRLRDSAPEKWAPWADEREDTTPKEIDAAIDATMKDGS